MSANGRGKTDHGLQRRDIRSALEAMNLLLSVYGRLAYLTVILTDIHRQNFKGGACQHSRKLERMILDAYKLAIECEDPENSGEWKTITDDCERYLNSGH